VLDLQEVWKRSASIRSAGCVRQGAHLPALCRL
jgi:hypothetical protein